MMGVCIIWCEARVAAMNKFQRNMHHAFASNTRIVHMKKRHRAERVRGEIEICVFEESTTGGRI